MFDLRIEVNIIALAYAKKLGFQVQKTNVDAQKIGGSTLETYGMVITSFQVQDKFEKTRFFQENFLVADICMEVVLGILFLAVSKVKVGFAEKKLT